MIVVEVGPGFVYAIRGKQVLQQTENAIRTGGIAASISDKISDGGKYIGEVEDLTAALRKSEGKGSTWLRKIADRFDASPASVNLIAEDDVYEAIAIANRVPRRSDAFITDGGTMYLRRSRGADILRDFAHEGTHALDIARGGMFKTVGSEWYAERLASMSPEQIFKREFRAYRIGDLVGDKPRFTSRKELVDHILSQYKFAMEP